MQDPASDQNLEALVARVEAVPGVSSASVAVCGLATGCQNISGIAIDGYQPAPGEDLRLRRIGRLVPDARPTPVEGVRVHGELGPFMVVRQSHLRGFTVGVRVTPLNQPTPKDRVWLVAETMATGASPAVVAPDSVDRERNAP